MADQRDEDIIELTDLAEDNAGEGDNKDDIIELTDVEPDVEPEPVLELEPEQVQAPEPSIVLPGLLPDGAPETENRSEGKNKDLPEVTMDQVEAALERVIEKKFSEKIESILFDVMEKVVTEEIKEIKQNLQKDLDQIGTT